MRRLIVREPERVVLSVVGRAEARFCLVPLVVERLAGSGVWRLAEGFIYLATIAYGTRERMIELAGELAEKEERDGDPTGHAVGV